jgi:4-diphosphocytidyl-2-C-methyl-D-erythritol kinase
MIRFPKAKINLGLQVLGQRADGYHEIRSILYPIGLCDVLELVPAPDAERTTLRSTGDPAHEVTADDLILRAFGALPSGTAVPPHRIHVHKRIPMGAGSGGGSADAGELLRHFGMKKGFEAMDPEDPFHQAASRIGSDVPFFLQEGPALVSGRGDRMEPVGTDLSGWKLLLLVPPFSIDTGEVYRNFAEANGAPPHLKELAARPVTDWPGSLRNDLEAPAFRMRPELRVLKEKLYKAGAAYASMTGSGSGIFALFEEFPGKIPGTEDHFEWREELRPLT